MTHWSSRKNAGFEQSQVPVVKGNISVGEPALAQHWSTLHRVNTRPFTLNLGFYHSPSSASLSPPAAGSLSFAVKCCHRYSSCSTVTWGIATGWNDLVVQRQTHFFAPSCDFSFFWERSSSVSEQNGMVKESLTGNLHTDGVIFFYSYDTVQSVFTVIVIRLNWKSCLFRG